METSQTSTKKEPKAPAKSRKARPAQYDRRQMIAEAAYYYAERRGFAEGGDLDDWLQAEAQIGYSN
ncbi:MAG: DUF2934 domain-containing protein [Sulfuricella sp.]|nr:DUF2934 domain-containing protein [Sulfuricella sp.]